MRIKFNAISLTIFVVSMLFSIAILSLYNGTPGFELLPFLPLSFGIMVIISGNMLVNAIPKNYGVTILLALLFFRSVIFPLLFALGNFSNTFGVSLNDYMPKAICLSVYEIIAIFITLNILDVSNTRKAQKIILKEESTYYNIKSMRFWVGVVLAIFVATFVLVPECKYFYLNISNISDVNFTNNEMSSIIKKYSTNFISKLVLVSHNYLTKIVRFIVPLHLIVEVNKKNQRTSGYMLCILISLLNIFVIDGTIARGFVYAFVLLLLTCIIYKRENSIYKVIIIAVIIVVLYFQIRAVFASGINNNVWLYLSSYVGSYFSSVANTAANLRMELTSSEKLQFFFYDYLESIPFGNTIFGLENISYQIDYNTVNACAGQIPTTIGTSYIYFGYFLAPIYSVVFTIIAYSSGLTARYSKSVFKIGVYMLLSVYCAMAITTYYIKIVLVVIIGTIIPMLIINQLVERKHQQRKDI